MSVSGHCTSNCQRFSVKIRFTARASARVLLHNGFSHLLFDRSSGDYTHNSANFPCRRLFRLKLKSDIARTISLVQPPKREEKRVLQQREGHIACI